MSDVRSAVIGAGPAGLAAALTLARSLQPTVVFDSPEPPRHAASPAIGGLLGRDRVTPAALKQAGREEIEGYGPVRFVDQAVARLEVAAGGGFRLVAADGSAVEAASVLLACGMVDEFPPIEGLEDFWGESVINCPFCHGIELRDRPWGVVVNRREMLDVAEIYTMWTGELTLFLDGGVEADTDREAELAAKNIRVERRAIRRLIGRETSLSAVELDDGGRVGCQALVIWPPQRQSDLVLFLNLKLDAHGCVIVDEGNRTDVPGLYAAGDLLYAGHQNVNTALHMGNLAAAAMVLDLAKRGWSRTR